MYREREREREREQRCLFFFSGAEDLTLPGRREIRYNIYIRGTKGVDGRGGSKRCVCVLL